MKRIFHVLCFCILICQYVFAFRIPYGSKFLKSSLQSTPQSNNVATDSSLTIQKGSMKLGGKIAITGLGSVEEDEFTLSLLNEQNMWTSVLLATTDIAAARKRFLSRTARYSGLLNILDFLEIDETSVDNLKSALDGCNSWVAFNVSINSISNYVTAALEAGVARVVFTVSLPSERLNDTSLPEFQNAIDKFSKAGIYFTGIRHGEIIPGSEDNSYEICNSTSPLVAATVERGVVGRIATEMLNINKTFNQECGLSSSGDFAAAYLNILRSSGLTRRQEVEKMFSGGLQRVAQLTVDEYERQRKNQEEKEALAAQRKLEESLELERQRNVSIVKTDSLSEGDDEVAFSFETEELELSEEAIIEARANQILQNVWREYDARMFTKRTNKLVFFDQNKDKALALAKEEIESEKIRKQEALLEQEATKLMVDRVSEVQKRQYSKLLALERREMQNQKQISDTWVKYIFLLLEVTMDDCKANNVLFYNLDEFQQTILLRKIANLLRQKSGLPSFEVIYDPLDASEIIDRLSQEEMGKTYKIDLPVEEVFTLLNQKYGSLLKSVSALRGATQIIELAIETIKKELPPPPSSVDELRKIESLAKQKKVSEKRLEATRNRGQPFSEGESIVGKL